MNLHEMIKAVQDGRGAYRIPYWGYKGYVFCGYGASSAPVVYNIGSGPEDFKICCEWNNADWQPCTNAWQKIDRSDKFDYWMGQDHVIRVGYDEFAYPDKQIYLEPGMKAAPSQFEEDWYIFIQEEIPR